MALIRDGISLEVREEITQRDKAMAGDLVFVLTPATVTRPATSATWTRDVLVELKSADGKLHDWFTKSITSGVSIANTSTLGTATISSTTLNIVNGKAVVTVTGSAHAWVAEETDTLTVAQATILGTTVAAKTSVQTFTA
jgi:hypothetical protein